MSRDTVTVRVRLYETGERFSLTDFEMGDVGGPPVQFEQTVPEHLLESGAVYREFDMVAHDVDLPAPRPVIAVTVPPDAAYGAVANDTRAAAPS